MGYRDRYSRLRKLVRAVNKTRKMQAKKIDILCNDVVVAHKDFIEQLNKISFAADFYETILGLTNLDDISRRTFEFIERTIENSNVAMILVGDERGERFFFDGVGGKAVDDECLRKSFDSQTVTNIAGSNIVCTLEDMHGLGLQTNPAKFGKIETLAIPLSTEASAIGIILLYGNVQNKPDYSQIDKIIAITSGLSKAIKSCRQLSQATNL